MTKERVPPRSEQTRDCGDKVHEQNDEITHHREIVTNLPPIRNLEINEFSSSRLLKKSETFCQSGDLIDLSGDKGGNGDARSG